MKYLREVTPYFRKSSLLGEIGWGNSLEHPPVDSVAMSADPIAAGETKVLSLHLCFVCRNVAMQDPRNSTIELHSPSGRNIVCLRTVDDRAAARWYSAIATAVEAASQTAIADANRLLADDSFTTCGNTRQVKHIGWLAEQVRIKHQFLNYLPGYRRLIKLCENMKTILLV